MKKERFKALRKLKRLNQEQVAEKLNVSIHTVRSWEQGAKEPRLPKLKQIAELFECTTDELI